MAIRGERDIVIDVTIKEDGRGAKEAARDLGEVDKSADKSAKSLGRVDKAADGAGKSLHTAASDQKLFREEVAKSTARIEELERTMLRTGDRSMRRAIASERSWLTSLKKIPLTEGAKSPFEGVAGARLGGVPLPAIIGGAIGVAAIGPLIGAVVAGAVSGAIGTGGIAGGILMASNDPKVKSAASLFGDNIAGEFFKGGDVFVKPILQSLTILNKAFRDMDLPGTFAKVAPLVTTIAEGFAGFGKNLMPGLNKAFERMGPFANVAREGIAELGDALGKFIDEVTASPGAIMGLDAMFKLISISIIGLGKGLHFLSDAFAGGLIVGEKLTGILEDIPLIGKPWEMMNDQINDTMSAAKGAGDGIEEFGDKAGYTADNIFDLGAAIAEANTQLRTLADQISGMINEQLGLDEANLAVEQGWADLTDAILTNGTALMDGTQAGRDNEERILSQIKALAAQRDAIIKVTGKTDEATAAYDNQILALIEFGTQLGLSKEKLEAIAGSYYVSVIFQSNLAAYLATVGSQIPGFGSNVTSFASGGDTPSFAPFRVHDGEMLFSSRQHYVATKGQVDSMGGGGSTQVVVSLDPSITGQSRDIVQAIAKMLRYEVRVHGSEIIGIPSSN